MLGKISRGYMRAVERFALDNQVPMIRFDTGASREEMARPHLERAEREGRFGVVMIGVAQERASVWRGWRDGGPDGHPHFEFSHQSAFPNHYYFYLRDPDWGRRSSRCSRTRRSRSGSTSTGASAKRQAERQGLGFEALDNDFCSVEDAGPLQAICDRLSAREMERFLRCWQARLPSPFTAEDRRRGYRHELAFRQLELSDTRVFDRPQAGRAWFEQTLRDQLALGRPDQVAIVFGRKVTRATPGRFQTKVIGRGVECALQVHYKRSKVKQYFKEGRALRTETTVNDTKDFWIGRRLNQEN